MLELDSSAFAEQDQIRHSLIIHMVTPGLGNQSLPLELKDSTNVYCYYNIIHEIIKCIAQHQLSGSIPITSDNWLLTETRAHAIGWVFTNSNFKEKSGILSCDVLTSIYLTRSKGVH